MRVSRMAMGYLTPASFTIPQNPFYKTDSDGMAGLGDLTTASFTIPQNPFYGTAQNGMAGLGCGGGCGEDQFVTGFGRAYPIAYPPGGMSGLGDVSLSSTGITALDSLGTTTIGTTVVANAWLIGGVALVAVVAMSGGGTGRRR